MSGLKEKLQNKNTKLKKSESSSCNGNITYFFNLPYMSLNTKQRERLEECQRMFLDGEISSREYEIEKSKIINGKSNNWTETDSGLVSSVIIPLFNHAIQSAKDGSLISSILLPLFHFIKFIIKGIYTLAKV